MTATSPRSTWPSEWQPLCRTAFIHFPIHGATHDHRAIAVSQDGVHLVRIQLRDRGTARWADVQRIRGNKEHVGSKGYTCEKALCLDYYQNTRDRLTLPMRRRPDGTHEQVSWDTVISEVAERLAAVRDTDGCASIFRYGTGGQGNHLGGVYGEALSNALGVRYRSNALVRRRPGTGLRRRAPLPGTHPWRLGTHRGRRLPRQEPLDEPRPS